MLGLFRHGVGPADTLVVVDFLYADLGALFCNVIETGLYGALGHQHHGLLSQPVCGPGYATAVVAVGGGEEGGLAEFLFQLVAGEIAVVHLGHILAQLAGDIAGHGKRAAQNLEGVEPEAVALILDEEAAQTQVFRHALELGQRGNAVLGETLMELPGLAHIFQAHYGQLLVCGFGHTVLCPPDLFHETSSLRCCSYFLYL